MQTVSPEFLQALSGSVTPEVQVSAWREGREIAADLPVTGGQVTITAGQSIRSRVQVSFTDGTEEYPEGSLVPRRPQDVLHPWSGTTLTIRAGLRLAQKVELVQLGEFVIVDGGGGQEKWRRYDRADGTSVRVAAATTTTVEAADLAHRVRRSRFLSVEQPSAASVTAEAQRILSGVIPWVAPAGLPTRTVPADIAYDADRLDAWTKLAGVYGMEPIIRPDGVGTWQTPALGEPVWTIDGGDEGVQVDWDTSASIEGAYNCVIVTGAEEAGKTPVRAMATIKDGPFRFNGAVGQIPYYYASPLVTTQPGAQSTAESILASLVTDRMQEVRVTCAWNPALEVGDTVTMVAPSGGSLPGRVTEATWALVPAPMTLKVAVNPDRLAEVS